MPITPADIEKAMADAVMLCAAEGISDPAIILERKLAARESVRCVDEEQGIVAKVRAEDRAREVEQTRVIEADRKAKK